MGVSNDAILSFGFSVGEEMPECLRDDFSSFEDFSDMMIAKMLKEPENFEYESSDNSSAWKEYYKKAKEIKASCPAEIQWYCSLEYPMNFVSLAGTTTRAHRGDAKEVEMKTVSQEEINKLKDFCETYGIEWQEPKWCIFSMNG